MKRIISLLTLLVPTAILAQTTNTVNTPVTLLQNDLPGIGPTTNLASYVSGAFTLSMAVGAAIAFVMITYGGIIYATADAISGKQNGKKYIRDAVTGLIILLGAFAILNTIDPELVNLNIGFQNPEVIVPEDSTLSPGGQIVGALAGCPQCTYRTVKVDGRDVKVLNGYVMSQEQIDNDLSARETLKNYITVNHDACTGGAETGCTNVNNLPSIAVYGLTTIGQECQCKFTLTGGTEGGHSTHGPGLSAVDIRATDLRPYLEKLNLSMSTINDGHAHTIRIGSVPVNIMYEPPGAGRSTGDHYHIVF